MSDAPDNGRARPTRYSDKVAAAICTRLAGGESLRAVCREPEMPAFPTVLRWAHEDRGGFRERYALAMEFRTQALAEELLEIADAAPAVATGAAGAASARVQAEKLKVDALKWLLARLAPRRYGLRATRDPDPPGDDPAPPDAGAPLGSGAPPDAGAPLGSGAPDASGECRITAEDEQAIRRIADHRERIQDDQNNPERN